MFNKRAGARNRRCCLDDENSIKIDYILESFSGFDSVIVELLFTSQLTDQFANLTMSQF